MLATGLSDPYTRFISGEQFAAMQSYDITGVGLNLCTAAELEEKTGLRPDQASWNSTVTVSACSRPPTMCSRRLCQCPERLDPVEVCAVGFALTT